MSNALNTRPAEGQPGGRSKGTSSDGITRKEFLGVTSAALAGALLATAGCAPAAGRVRALDQPHPEGDEWAFRSRPDLRVPTATVTKRPKNTSPGYVFLAPKNGPGETGPGRDGCMIVDNSGEPVWFRPVGGEDPAAMDAMDFKVQTYRGENVLTWWEGVHTGYGQGEYVIADAAYREVARVRAGNNLEGDHHEFLITEQDTALIAIYAEVPYDLSPFGGPKDGALAEGVVQEIDVASGEVLFEWRSLEHVPIEETHESLPEEPTTPYDYLHVNSIDVDGGGNLLVSARLTSTVYKIDRQRGEVVWRLGGRSNDFEMGEGASFAYQHDARRLSDGTIIVFDNGEAGKAERSRTVVLRLDEGAMEASLVSEFVHPDGILSRTQANAQRLPNGNTFVGWGSEPHFSEFSSKGELLFSASLPPGVESYRAFRFPWAGRPEGEPSVVAGTGPALGEVSLHASWNGATEVAAWRILAGPAPNRLRSLGIVARTGFETAMAARTGEPYVGVEALDVRRKVLGRSQPVRSPNIRGLE